MGIPVEIVAPEERQQALDNIRAEYPNMVIIDYTLPGCVNGTREKNVSRNSLFFPQYFFPGTKTLSSPTDPAQRPSPFSLHDASIIMYR